MRRFLESDGGGVAIIFGLALLPVFGSVAAAVDFSRISDVRALLQAQADSVALDVASRGIGSSLDGASAYLVAAVEASVGQGTLSDIDVEVSWLNASDFEVRVTAAYAPAMVHVLPGIPDQIQLGATAMSRATQQFTIYQPPKVTQLDPEASDYNQVSIYCFDPVSKARTKMTVIADNGGTKYTYTMPRCEGHQNMSYMLRNVRDARTNKKKWNDAKAEQYRYYTDTRMVAGVEQYDLGGWAILETVFCDTLAKCKPKSQGGVIPTGKERTAQRASKACQEGKFMYYGWEDRPPGMGWTDRDYDDIRIVIECPRIESIGPKEILLVR